jgi:hypothetical protein
MYAVGGRAGKSPLSAAFALPAGFRLLITDREIGFIRSFLFYEDEVAFANAGSEISWNVNALNMLVPYGNVKLLRMLPAAKLNQRL